MLKVEHVTFRYERRGAPVLRDASLSLETGQVGVLLGRNGCGKTTLLKTTLGLCTPEQGQILFDGQALGAMKRQQRAQVAAYVPQELQFGALRVYDAVLAGRLGKKGANFVTWEWDFDRNGVRMGHYFIEDYASAKRDFAARSGLIEPQRLFSDKELGVIRNACEFALTDDATLTYGDEKRLRSVQEQIDMLLPRRQEQKLEQEQEQERQSTMEQTM